MATTKPSTKATSKKREQAAKKENFRIPPSDSKGNSIKQYFRCQPGHDAAMTKVVNKTKLYENKGQFMRHAMTRHLKWLDENDASELALSMGLVQTDLIMEVIAEQEFEREFEETFGRLGTAIDYKMGKGLDGEAQALLLRIESIIKQMPKESKRRTRYEEELTSRFGHLKRGARKAKLTTRGDKK